MKHFLVIKKINSQSGFNLLEMLLVTIIIGIATAVATPSLVASRQDSEAKEIFTQIRGALIQAQAEANRVSNDCGIGITTTKVTKHSDSSSECRISSANIDSSVVSVTSSGDMSKILYTFRGTTANGQTLFITRKKSNGDPYLDVARCIVISNFAMIRTGVYDDDADSDCRNSENDQYDSYN